MCACCCRQSPRSFHLQTSLLPFCILALRSDAQTDAHLSSRGGTVCAMEIGGWRGWGGEERRYARARVSHRFLRGVLYRFLGRVVRWQAAFPGAGRRISGAFTDANAVPLEPGGWGWGWRGGGGEAGRRHVSSSACQCKARLQPSQCTHREKKMGEICCISRGGACSTPTIPPKTHNL